MKSMIRKYPIIAVRKESFNDFSENDIYSDEGIYSMTDEDQLSIEENGFMTGYISA